MSEFKELHETELVSVEGGALVIGLGFGVAAEALRSLEVAVQQMGRLRQAPQVRRLRQLQKLCDCPLFLIAV